jgi:hypothetical protein
MASYDWWGIKWNIKSGIEVFPLKKKGLIWGCKEEGKERILWCLGAE